MEFILVAHAIIVGLAVAEILRSSADLIRAKNVRVCYRLLLIAAWALLLLLQLWWAIWKVGAREVWTFPEFMVFLLPAGLLYMIARFCFPMVLTGTNLVEYYLGVSRAIWILVAATYASFAFLMQPFIFERIVPVIFGSQVIIMVLALAAVWIRSPGYQVFVTLVMLAQVIWRGLSDVIGQ